MSTNKNPKIKSIVDARAAKAKRSHTFILETILYKHGISRVTLWNAYLYGEVRSLETAAALKKIFNVSIKVTGKVKPEPKAKKPSPKKKPKAKPSKPAKASPAKKATKPKAKKPSPPKAKPVAKKAKKKAKPKAETVSMAPV